MPFTPYHMGPGILFKALLRGGFSLMIFGWVQILMDLQPLIVMVTNEGRLHGSSHTYLGATLIAFFAAVSGKYLVQFVLGLLPQAKHRGVGISWAVAFLSAFVGSYSHVALDSIMHSDVVPFWPFSQANHLLGIVSASVLQDVCVYSGLAGAALYFIVSYLLSRHNKRIERTA